MSKMTALENEIEKRDNEHQEEIYKLERKQVVDKDR